MINIVFKPNTYELEITGHAGTDKKGKDIVCSAVSCLFYTLANSLDLSVNMLNKEPAIKDKEGNGYIRCYPKKEFEGNIARTYWTILVGLQMLSERYPDNISFNVKIEG